MREARLMRQGNTAMIKCRVATKDCEAEELLASHPSCLVRVEGGSTPTWVWNGDGAVRPEDLAPIVEFLHVHHFDVQAERSDGTLSPAVYAFLDDISRQGSQAP